MDFGISHDLKMIASALPVKLVLTVRAFQGLTWFSQSQVISN